MDQTHGQVCCCARFRGRPRSADPSELNFILFSHLLVFNISKLLTSYLTDLIRLHWLLSVFDNLFPPSCWQCALLQQTMKSVHNEQIWCNITVISHRKNIDLPLAYNMMENIRTKHRPILGTKNISSIQVMILFQCSLYLETEKGLECWANFCGIVSFFTVIWKWVRLRKCKCSTIQSPKTSCFYNPHILWSTQDAAVKLTTSGTSISILLENPRNHPISVFYCYAGSDSICSYM